MDKLKWGIIGTGGIARKLAQAVTESETGQLYAVGSRAQHTADQFGSAFNIPRRYPSYEALLADPKVDVVYIALPNHLHAEWAAKAAQAGKHILCEKPLTVNADQTQELVDVVRQSGVFMMEAFMYRCHPQTQRLIELIRGGEIGQVRMIQANFGYDLGDSDAAYNNIRLRGDVCGGSIMDVGCYTVSMARLIAGAALGREAPAEPIRLEGMAHVGQRGGVDEWAAGVARFPDDIIANLACAARVRLDSAVHVWGSTGALTVPVPWNPERGQILLRRPGAEPTEIDIPPSPNSYILEVDAVARALPAQQAPYPCMTWQDSLGNMQALDMWRTSIGLIFNRENLH